MMMEVMVHNAGFVEAELDFMRRKKLEEHLYSGVLSCSFAHFGFFGFHSSFLRAMIVNKFASPVEE